MERQSVASSNIAGIGYDPATETMEISFISGGVYSYQGVTAEEYATMRDAPSIGSFFAKFIKGNKAAERIE